MWTKTLCFSAVELLKRWAITKEGYTQSVWGQKRVHSGIKSKIHHEPRDWQKTNRTRFPEMNEPGTPVNGYKYYAWLSTVLGYFFCFTLGLRVFVVYIVLHCCFGRYFLFSFLVYFCSFSFSLRVSFHSIQPLFAPGYVRPHVRTYKPCTYYIVSLRLLYYLC